MKYDYKHRHRPKVGDIWRLVYNKKYHECPNNDFLITKFIDEKEDLLRFKGKNLYFKGEEESLVFIFKSDSWIPTKLVNRRSKLLISI